jgi:hypothetical protein
MRWPLDGGVPIVVASGQNNPSYVVVDATNAYWTDSNGGTVMKAALTGGAPVTLASGQGSPAYIAVDSTSVYWTNTLAGTVMKATPK